MASRVGSSSSALEPPPLLRRRSAPLPMSGGPQLVLLVNGFAQNPREPTDVSVFVVQCSQAGELVPPSEAISQEQLDALVSAGRMPGLCMGSEELGRQWAEFGAIPGISMSFVVGSPPAPAQQAAAAAAAGPEAGAAAAAAPQQASGSAEYFCSYEDLSIHELMLKDRPRTETYREAISAAISRVAHERRAAAELGVATDEPVRLMDVGAGTGILSMCAAAAAAQQGVPIEIFAVEGSKMAAVAQQLVAANGFSAVVRVIHSAVEELDALPAFGSHAAQKVDIIVSEWMGFYLLHESMLSSVLVARDRWLRPGGLMLPSQAAIFAAPVSAARSLGWWGDVYGFNYSALAPQILAASTSRNPQCDQVVEAADLVGDRQCVASIDCCSVTAASLGCLRKQLHWQLQKGASVHGLALWFDCVFPAPAPTAGSNEPPREIVLSTSPTAPKTHWHQTMIHFGADALAQGEAMQTDQKAAAAGQAAFDCTVELKVDPAAPRSYRISVNC